MIIKNWFIDKNFSSNEKKIREAGLEVPQL